MRYVAQRFWLNNVNFNGMNLTIDDRHKIKPFIDWLIDNELGTDPSQLYSHMNDYFEWLQKGREEVVKINGV